MSGLLSTVIFFMITVSIIDIIVKSNKKKPKYRTIRKKTHEKIVKPHVKNHEQIGYAIPEKKIYIHKEPIKPTNERNTKWDKTFLQSLEWKRYEEVCMEYLRIKNCAADVTCTGADGGIDIKIADKNGNMLAIGQCKAWNKPIGVSLIRELYGVKASEQIKHGIFLTTSIYSQEAIEFAKNKALLLIDGDVFVKLINDLDEINKQRIDQIATEGDYTTPTCVHCNVKMIKRIATKGKDEGNAFWGCINYPKCRKTMFIKI